ncbi:unnamed protein product, partial [Iphiclides podalirius]
MRYIGGTLPVSDQTLVTLSYAIRGEGSGGWARGAWGGRAEGWGVRGWRLVRRARRPRRHSVSRTRIDRPRRAARAPTLHRTASRHLPRTGNVPFTPYTARFACRTAEAPIALASPPTLLHTPSSATRQFPPRCLSTHSEGDRCFDGDLRHLLRSAAKVHPGKWSSRSPPMFTNTTAKIQFDFASLNSSMSG